MAAYCQQQDAASSATKACFPRGQLVPGCDSSRLLDRLEREISTSGYLVGESFTVADLTVAALFYGVARPPEFPYPMIAHDDLPDAWRELSDSLAQRPGGQWVTEISHRHRGRSAELTPGQPVRRHGLPL